MRPPNDEYNEQWKLLRTQEKKPLKQFVLPPMEPLYSTMMEDYLEERQLSHQVAVFNGWYPAYVKKEPRVIIRSVSMLMPGLGFWQGRSMLREPQLRYDSPYGNRGDSLCVVHGSNYKRDTLAVCEGPMDALAAAGVPRCDGVATFGAMPSQAQLEHLELLSRKYRLIIVLPDKDYPAYAGKIVMALHNAESIAILECESCKDLASLGKEDREKLINSVRS